MDNDKKKFEIPSCESCTTRIRSIFSNLKGVDLNDISFNKGCNIYKKGQAIFYEGARPTGLYCINSGKAKVFKLGSEGKEQIVRLAKEGDVLGYRSLISDEVYSATAVTLDDACVCFIPKSTFFDLVHKNHSFSLKVMQLITKDLKGAEHKVTDIAQKPVRERVAETLLTLRETYGEEEDGVTIAISLTREDLANIVGTATETVIRLLSEFKGDNIIAMDGRKIKILDRNKLIQTAKIFD